MYREGIPTTLRYTPPTTLRYTPSYHPGSMNGPYHPGSMNGPSHPGSRRYYTHPGSRRYYTHPVCSGMHIYHPGLCPKEASLAPIPD